MDITLVFKVCVKTIKTKQRAFEQSSTVNGKTRILLNKQKQEFTVKSKEIVQQITRLNDFLCEHQQAYLNFSNHLSGRLNMSDAERDKIDAGAQRIINVCSNQISELAQEVTRKGKGQNQMFEHQNLVITLMREYLKQVCNKYSEQRAVRVQHTIEVKKLMRIDSNSSPKNQTQEQNNQSVEKVKDYNKEFSSSIFKNEILTTEEQQIFELENNELFNELNNMMDEVKQIESKVVKIAELQEIFTEKVLKQHKDLDQVAAMVVGTTENVKDANDLIRQAIQRNAGLRVWVLFFLIVMSFSLLFLDWYND